MASTASAQCVKPEQCDTVMVVRNASSVVITESAQGVNLSVRGTADDPDFITNYAVAYDPDVTVTTRQRFAPPSYISVSGHNPSPGRDALDLFNGIHAGFCGTLGAPAGLGVEMGKSYEIGIDNIVSYRLTSSRMRNALNVGIGVNWRNYRMTANTRFVVDDNGVVGFGPYPEGTESRYSRVKLFSVSVPLLWTQNTSFRVIGNSTFAAKLGVILNWNSHASVTSCWTEADGTSAKAGTKHVEQRLFTVDLLAAVRLAPSTGLYVKYSPMRLFRDGFGPRFTTISTGIYFGF